MSRLTNLSFLSPQARGLIPSKRDERTPLPTLTGTLDSADWQAGQTGTLGGSVDIYSRNLDFGAIPSLGGGAAFLELLFDAEGQQKAAQPQYSASDLTVTGMPIERAEAQSNEAIHIGDFSLTDYEQVGSGHGRASWMITRYPPGPRMVSTSSF